MLARRVLPVMVTAALPGEAPLGLRLLAKVVDAEQWNAQAGEWRL